MGVATTYKVPLLRFFSVTRYTLHVFRRAFISLLPLVLASCALPTLRFPKPAADRPSPVETRDTTAPQAPPAATPAVPATPALPLRIHQVALLLPLSSSHARAANAVRDGFLAMQRAAPEADKPIVKVYDTGADDGLREVYETAQREGAEFIVGPLGRRAADKLVQSGALTTPTLLLGTPLTPPAQPNVFQFALDPEQDARQAAEHLYFRGHRIVATLTPASETGRRVAEAFRRHFEEIGGMVPASAAYNENTGDHAQAIKSLLDLTGSEHRKARLAAALRVPIEFTPRRRRDLDALFLHAGPAQARLLRPQLGYYQALDLPVYGTPQVYTGRPDPIADGDLEGLHFGDMPWLLAQNARIQAARDGIQGNWPYRHSEFDRLYALGMDAYSLPASLPRLRAEPAAWLDGMTAELGLDANGVITRRLTWARFDRGRPVLQDVPKL
jgi:outer membrane PBP1 activator LpoA protein